MAGEAIEQQWADWGVHVSTNDPSNHPLMIFDSAHPNAGSGELDLSNLGSPHIDFDGPGVGAGGQSGSPGENNTALDNLLIVSSDGNPNDPSAYDGSATISFAFDSPATVHEVQFLNAGKEHQTLWGIDEDDGRLFSIEDYSDPADTFTDYGLLKYDDGVTTQFFGNNIEAFALDHDGTAYLAFNESIPGVNAPILLSFDISGASTSLDNVATVVG